MNGFERALLLARDALDVLTGATGYGIAIWFLAFIFTWSGIAKMRRPTLAAMAMVDFGVVRHLRPRLGFALGTIELLLALFLALGVYPSLFLYMTDALLWCVGMCWT